MEPRAYVTNGLSRNVRSMVRARLTAEALQSDPDSYHLFTIRGQNECYACRLKSLATCLNSCTSTANPNPATDRVQVLEVRLEAAGGLGGGSGGGGGS